MPSSRRPARSADSAFSLHHLDDVHRLHRQLAALGDERVELGVRPAAQPQPDPIDDHALGASSNALERPAASAAV